MLLKLSCLCLKFAEYVAVVNTIYALATIWDAWELIFIPNASIVVLVVAR